MDHGLSRPRLALQPGLQQVCLPEGHIFLPEPQAHPAPALMYDGRSHNRSLLMEKGSRLPAPFRGFSGLLALYLSLGFLGGPTEVTVSITLSFIRRPAAVMWV